MTDAPTPQNKQKIRVLIADDSRLTRVSLKTTLQHASEELELVGEAENGLQILDLVSNTPADVILMDIGMPQMDGIQATQNIRKRFPELKVIMLTSHDAEKDVLDAFQSGATSYCLKETPPEMLVHIIVSTAHGACWIDPKIARIVMSRLHEHQPQEPQPTHSESSLKERLTERELEVLQLITEGLNNTEISERLCISMNTVKTHLKNVFQKLEVEDRTSAALKALKEQFF